MHQFSGKLLIIDDDARHTELLRDYLGTAGFRVSHAESGRGGLALLARETFDAVILDLMLPDLDGVALKALASASPQPPAVILMTAREDWWDRSIDTLRKPIQLPLLFAAIARALEPPASCSC